MELLPIDQQSCGPLMVPLHVPEPNHLVSSSYTSFFCHTIFYDVQIPFGYFLGLPGRPTLV